MRSRPAGATARTLAVAAALLASLPGEAAQRSPAPSLTVRDSLRRSIAVPVPARRILSLQPEITRIAVALGAGESLVGVDYFIRENDHLFNLVFPPGRDLPAVSKPDESVNRELVVQLAPDVIFASPTEQQVPDSIQRSLGVPVVALASMGRLESLLEEIELVGRITGRSERAARLIGYFRRRVEDVAGRVRSSAAAGRPRVYLAFWSSLIRTPVSYEPVDLAGGLNVADGLLPSYLGTIGAVINLERLIRWDPDIILVQGNYLPKDRLVTVPGLLRDRRLGSVKAVRSGRVHYTFGFWYWWDPAGVLAETIYLAWLFHPGTFADVDIEGEGNAVFREFYGRDGLFTALTEALGFDDWTAR